MDIQIYLYISWIKVFTYILKVLKIQSQMLFKIMILLLLMVLTRLAFGIKANIINEQSPI